MRWGREARRAVMSGQHLSQTSPPLQQLRMSS